jgi:phosphinothricin acetyltransferase
MTTDYVVRDAAIDDATACASIYAPYVTGTAVTFETDPPERAEMAKRIAAALASHAWVVLADRGRVVGYAYAGPYKSRAAYRWSCEVSVYVEIGRRRTGAGRALYEALFERLERRGYRMAVAGMTLPNEASVGMHRAMGFEPVGTYLRIGWKDGAWHDVAWAQRHIGTGTGPPSDAGEPSRLFGDETGAVRVTAGTISVDDPRADDARKLLAEHLSFCREETPPQDVHALDITDLLGPAITFFGYRVEGKLVAVGALKAIDVGHAEVKSMHTERSARRTGAGGAVLGHIISVARERGFRRLSLETGAMEAFAPARALYEKAGFVPCGPFADYPDTPNSTYMTMTLAAAPTGSGKSSSSGPRRRGWRNGGVRPS